MVIKTNLNKLSDLSAKLKRLERDIADYGYRASRLARNTAQNTKYQYYSNYRVRNACNNVLNEVDTLERNIRQVENELAYQSGIVSGAVNSYRNADTIEEINKGAVSYVGSHLGGVFGSLSFSNYSKKINPRYSGFLNMFPVVKGVKNRQTEDNKSFVSFNSPEFDVFDAVGLGKSGRESLNTYNKLKKSGFFESGFRVVQKGDYLHVYGNNNTWKNLDDAVVDGIKGRRYKLGSSADINAGVSSFAENVSTSVRLSNGLKHNFQNFGKKTFASKAAVGDYVLIGLETGYNVYNNVKSGEKTEKILADATTDVAKGAGSMATSAVGANVGATVGSAIGSIIPGAGTAVGAIVGGFVGGAVASFAYDYAVDGIKIGGKSISGWVSSGLETAYTAVGDAAKKGVKAVGNVAKKGAETLSNAAKSVTNTVKETAKKTKEAVNEASKRVGDAAKGAAASVKNFFKNIL